MKTTIFIVLTIVALLAFDIIMDIIILKKMGYSVSGVLRTAWDRLTFRWKKPNKPQCVVWINDEDVHEDDDEDWSRP